MRNMKCPEIILPLSISVSLASLKNILILHPLRKTINYSIEDNIYGF